MMPQQPTAFQRGLEQLRDNTAVVVMGIYASMLEAELSKEDVIDVLVPVLQRAAIEGQAMARGEFARMAERIEIVTDVTEAVEPVSFTNTATERLQAALETALEDDDAAPQRLERLARADPIEETQRELSRSMRSSDEIVGWRRVLDADHCEICGWLYRDGHVYKPSQELWAHPGCLCTAAPVTRAERAERSARRAAERRARNAV